MLDLVGHHTLVGVIGAERCRLDRHGTPIGTQFIGNDLRQPRPDALAHLGLGHRHRDTAIGSNLDESIDELLALPCRPDERASARPDGPANGKAAASAGGNQQGTA